MSCSRLNVIGGSLSGLLLMAAMCGARAEAQATPDPSTGPASASITDASTRPSTSSGTQMPTQSMDSAVVASAPTCMKPSAAPPIVKQISAKVLPPPSKTTLLPVHRQQTADIEQNAPRNNKC